MRDKPYVSAVGALMYLAIATHPDIAHAVGVLCRFTSKPGPAHWKAAKHLFRYLRGSIDYRLTHTPDPSSPQLFTTYSDADHGGNPDNGRSTSAYVVTMGTGTVSWMSRLQSIVALLTTEVEFISAVSAGQAPFIISALVLTLLPAASAPPKPHRLIGYEPRHSGVIRDEQPVHFTIEEIPRIPSCSDRSPEPHILAKRVT
jgi:hypothetical protein